MDTLRRRHICLVSWDELAEAARQYNALIGAAGEDARDFQQSNLKIAERLPIFARAYQARAGQSRADHPQAATNP
jgi:hypothetical protein